MRGSGENALIAIGLIGMAALFFPMFLGTMNGTNDNEECELEWVECTDDDRIGDCEEHTKEIITGPYWNETIEIKTTMRKQVCED